MLKPAGACRRSRAFCLELALGAPTTLGAFRARSGFHQEMPARCLEQVLLLLRRRRRLVEAQAGGAAEPAIDFPSRKARSNFPWWRCSGVRGGRSGPLIQFSEATPDFSTRSVYRVSG